MQIWKAWLYPCNWWGNWDSESLESFGSWSSAFHTRLVILDVVLWPFWHGKAGSAEELPHASAFLEQGEKAFPSRLSARKLGRPFDYQHLWPASVHHELFDAHVTQATLGWETFLPLPFICAHLWTCRGPIYEESTVQFLTPTCPGLQDGPSWEVCMFEGHSGSRWLKTNLNKSGEIQESHNPAWGRAAGRIPLPGLEHRQHSLRFHHPFASFASTTDGFSLQRGRVCFWLSYLRSPSQYDRRLSSASSS